MGETCVAFTLTPTIRTILYAHATYYNREGQVSAWRSFVSLYISL